MAEVPEAKEGFILQPCRWVVERSFGCAGRCRRFARDEWLPDMLAGMHFPVFAIMLLKRFVELMLQRTSRALDGTIETWSGECPSVRGGDECGSRVEALSERKNDQRNP
jgi:hypothetical protein